MKIEIYSRENCGQCVQAKNFLKSKCVEFEEKILDEVHYTVNDLKERVKATQSSKPVAMLPQIFVDEEHLGSFNDLRTFINDQSLGCQT